MIDFYNAFISYRHAPLDSKIAEHVQKKLEHFHVPHKLRGKIKHQKITRIFRDKDELPITSDLTETITQALQNAEYLIVICSTNTKESYWVKREIKTFLQTHSANNILTVLCDGEPFEVIPEELLSIEKQYIDENGFPHTVKVPVEPLSCDYRLPMSTADKEELPRLASALLGCSYDELQRRTRQYKIRRAAALAGVVFAAMAAFVGYMIYSNNRINSTYLESLRSRAAYLSNESEQLLAEGKRTDSIHLALAALPNDSNKKIPVTSTAVRALTDATGAYSCIASSQYTPCWNYKTDKPITHFAASDDEHYLAALDQGGKAYCWDAFSHKCVFENECEQVPKNITFLDDDLLMLTYDYSIEAYSYETGDLIWSYDSEKETAFIEDDVVYSSHAVYFEDGEGRVIELTTRDGSIKNTYQVKDAAIFDDIRCLTVSPDGNRFAYTDNSFIFNNEGYVHIYDKTTGTTVSKPVYGYLFYNLEFIDNDHACAITTNSTGLYSTAYSNEMTFIAEESVNLFCFDCVSNKDWESEMTVSDLVLRSHIRNLPSRNAVLFALGETATIRDIDTGEELNKYATGSTIITVDDFNHNDFPEFICRQGEYILTISADNNSMAEFQLLGKDITFAKVNELLYTVPRDGCDIICYNRYLQDDEWTEISSYGGFVTGSSYQTCYTEDDLLIIAARVHNTNDVRVSAVNMADGELIFSDDIPDVDSLLNNFFIDRIDDEYYGFFGDRAFLIDVEHEEVRNTDIEFDAFDYVSNGKRFTLSRKTTKLDVTVSDIDGSHSKDFKTLDVGEDASTFFRGIYYLKDVNKAFIPLGNRLIAADLESMKLKEIKIPCKWMENVSAKYFFTASEDGSQFFFTDGCNAFVTDGSFKEMYSFTFKSSARYSATFRDGILYIVADNFLILRDGTTGQLLNKYEMGVYGSGAATFRFDDKNHLLFIQNGDEINIFDTETWVEVADVCGVYCYHEKSDRFFVYSYMTEDDCRVGYIDHYTVDDLIEKGKRILDGHELSEEVRAEYGI